MNNTERVIALNSCWSLISGCRPFVFCHWIARIRRFGFRYFTMHPTSPTPYPSSIVSSSKHLISSFAYIVLCCLMLLSSCKKDDDDVTTATRDDYTGLWLCEEFDQNMNPAQTYQVEIIKHQTNSTKVWIDNFNQLGIGYQAEATIDNTSIILPQQIVGIGFHVSGSGFITNNHTTIEFQYFVDNENITATYTKL